jgi:hypothetical protein
MAMPVGSMVRRWRSEFDAVIASAREAAPAPLDSAAPIAVGT